MRLLYFVNHYPVANQPVYEDEARTLIRMGHEVWLIPVWGPLVELTKTPDDLRDRLLEMPAVYTLDSLLGALAWIFQKPIRTIRYIRQARIHVGFSQTLRVLALVWKVRLLQLDRIHAHFASNAALQGLLCADLLGLPFSCTGHGTETLIEREPYLPLLIQRARPFITISNYNRQRVTTEIEVAKSVDIKVVRCGIDLSLFDDVPDRSDVPDTPVILSVTWLKQVKGVPYLIEACDVLRKRGNRFTCVIIGGGELRAEAEYQIADQGLGEFIKLTGPLNRQDVLAWYRKADVFALPSLSEGIPLALMEAMAMKLPVVATRITGIPELVTDGTDGLLVEPGDGAAIADALQIMLTTPELRRKLSGLARRKIEREFDLKVNAGRLLEALEDVDCR